MNIDPKDNSLKHLFDELKRRDAQYAPSFDRVVQTPVRRTERVRAFSNPWIRAAAAAVALIVVVAALAVFHYSERRSRTDDQRWASLSQWTAPTDVLLNVSSASWGNEITTPTDSLISGSSDTSDANQQSKKDTL